MSSKDFQGSLSEGSEKVAKETWQAKSVGGKERKVSSGNTKWQVTGGKWQKNSNQ
jgi:CRISPR/Cas system-associated protein Cas5 (RAMP superfamily)